MSECTGRCEELYDICKNLRARVKELEEENKYLHEFTDITSIVENKDLREYKDAFEWLCKFAEDNEVRSLGETTYLEPCKFNGFTLKEAIQKAMVNNLDGGIF